MKLKENLKIIELANREKEKMEEEQRDKLMKQMESEETKDGNQRIDEERELIRTKLANVEEENVRMQERLKEIEQARHFRRNSHLFDFEILGKIQFDR